MPHSPRRNLAALIARRAGLVMEPIEPRLLLSSVMWDGGGSTHLWNDARNWSADVLPQPGDDVFIPAGTGTIQFTSDAIVHSVTSDSPVDFTAGTLKTDADQTYRAIVHVGRAAALNASAGSISIIAPATTEMSDWVDIAGSVRAPSISIDAGPDLASMITGTLDARGIDTGGRVVVTGHRVVLVGASVDASGPRGGGTVLIGGGRHGQGSVRSALSAFVDRKTVIHANATVAGPGGSVVVWSNDATGYYGSISADGASGDGGEVETSGANTLDLTGKVEARSGAGSKRGQWLLDPRNVTISASATSGGTFGGGNPNTFTPNANNANILNSAISGPLSSAISVVITTSNGAGVQSGDITVNAPILKNDSGACTLSLLAAGDIRINATISDTVISPLSLVLTANDAGQAGQDPSPTVGSIFVSAGIAVIGTITMSGVGITIAAPVTNQGVSAATLTAGSGGMSFTSAFTGGTCTFASSGSVTQTGTGVITASALALSGSGSYILTGAANDTSTLAASLTGSAQLAYLDGNNFTVGSVSGINGISAPNTIGIGAGSALTIANAITASSGTLTIQADIVDVNAAVTCNGGITISPSHAGVQMGLNSEASLSLSNAELALLFCTSTVTFGIPQGGTLYTSFPDFSAAGYNVSLVTGDNLSLGGITLPAGRTLTLNAANGATQSSAIVATNLRLLGTGSYVLANAANNVTILAGSLTGSLTYNDVDALTVGIVTTIGLTTVNSNMSLFAGGQITLSQSVNTGTGTLVLSSNSAGVTQSGGAIVAAAMRVICPGFASLPQGTNSVGVMAGSVGSLTLVNNSALTIGTVAQTTGLSSGGNVSITTAGQLTLSQNLSAPGSTITLNPTAGGATQTGGALTAANLRLQGAGPYVVGQSGNDVDVIAGSVAGSVTFTDADDLIVGTVTTIGLTVTGGASITLTTGAALTLAQSLSAAGGTIALDPLAGGVNQTGGAVTAAALQLIGIGPYVLGQASNDVDTISGVVSGAVTFTDIDDLSIPNTSSGLDSGGNPITLTSGGAMVLAQNLTAAGSTITLNVATGGVSQTAGVLTSANLRLLGAGTITLNRPNDTGTIAGIVAGAISFTDVNSLVVGTVTTVGLTATGGFAITLNTGTGLTITQNLSAAASTITLNPTTGGVSQLAAAITAANLRLLGGAGTFSLAQAGNDVDVLAGNIGGAVVFNDIDDLIIGTVTTAGLTTANSAITLNTGGPLTLTQALSAGTGTITFNVSAGGLNQSGGTLAAANLRLLGAGAFTINQSSNDVDIIAGLVAGPIIFTDIDGLNVGTVTTVGLTATGGNSITLNTGAALVLSQNVSSAASTLTLNAVAGGVTQSGGAIVASNLRLTGSGAFTLTQSLNDVDVVAGNVAGNIILTDADDLMVGTVVTPGLVVTGGAAITLNTGAAISLATNLSAAAGSITLNPTAGGVIQTLGSLTAANLRLLGAGTFNLTQLANDADVIAGSITGSMTFTDVDDLAVGVVTTVGLTVTGGASITLNTGATIILAQNLSAAGGTLTLNPAAGGVNQTGGAITTANLRLLGAGTFTFNQAANDTDIVAGSVTGSISFTDADDLNVGTVVNPGLTSNGNAITLNTGAALTLSQPLTAGGSTVTLNPTTGGVNQTNGALAAGNLRLLGAGTFTLNWPANDVDTLAGAIAGSLSLTDVNNLVIGTVTTVGLTVTGGSSIVLTPHALLTLAQNVSAAGGTITFNPATVGVTQSGGSILAAGLRLLGAGTFTLTSGGNDVDTLAGLFSGALSLTDLDDLTVGTVTTVGLNSTGGAVTLTTGGVLTLNQNLTATVSTVTFNTSAGGVNQTAGTITTGSLRLLGSGSFLLTSATNDFDVVAGGVSGIMAITDVDDLTVGTVAGTLGLNSSGNNITLTMVTGLTLTQSITAASSAIVLAVTSGSITQSGGAITAAGLRLTVGFTASLNQAANNVGALAGTVGILTYIDADAVSIGSVSGVNGLTATGVVTITAGGALSIVQSLSAAASVVTFNVQGVTESPGASVVCSSLLLQGLGAFDLNQSGNNTTTFAANVTGALTYSDADGLTIGTVGVTSGITCSTLNLFARGALSVVTDISAGPTLNLQGGLSGTGDMTFAGGTDLFASTITLIAGDGAGGAGNAARVQALNNTPLFHGAGGGTSSPQSLLINQDGPVTDSVTPIAAQYTGGLAFVALDFRSADSSITVSNALKVNAGNGLTLIGATGVTIGAAIAPGVLLVDGAGSIFINGGSVTTTGSQTYNRPVILGADTTLTSAALTFSTAVDSDATRRSLTLNPSGVVTMNGALGVGSALQSLVLTTNGDITLRADIVTSASLSLWSGTDGTGDVRCTLAGVDLSGSSITLRAGDGPTGGNGAVVDTVTLSPAFHGALGAGSPATLILDQDAPFTDVQVPSSSAFPGGPAGINYTLRSRSSTVTVGTASKVAGTLLTLDSPTNAIISAAMSPASLSVIGPARLDGAPSTSGQQNYNGAVSVTQSMSLSASALTFASTLAGAITPLTLNAPGGTITFGGLVSSFLTLTATAATISVNGGVSTSSTQQYTGAVTLAGNSTFDGASGSVSFQGTLAAGPRTLLVRGTEIDFNGAVSGTSSLALEPAAANQAIVIGGSGSTPGVDLFSAEVARLSNGFSSITIGRADGSGSITIASAVSFSDPITLRAPVAPGQIIINARLTLTDNASINFVGSGSTVILNADLVTNGQAIIFNDSVLIGVPSVLIDTTNNGAAPAGASITFNLTLNSEATEFNALSIRQGLGTTSFFRAVGAVANSALSSLTIAAGGQTFIACPSITTVGGQTYGNAVVVNASAVLTGGAITFSSTLDEMETPESLLLTTTGAGPIRFNGIVGGSTPLSSIQTAGGSGTRINTSLIRTTDGLNFQNQVTIEQNVTLNSASVGLNGALDGGGFSLQVTCSGIASFDAAVTNLLQLTTDAPGVTSFAASVQTTGLQSFADAVQIDGDSTLSSTTGLVTFNSTVSVGANTLFLIGDEIDFHAAVSGSGHLWLEPARTNQEVDVGSNPGNPAALQITAPEIALFQDGFASLYIGRPDGNGVMNVDATLFADSAELNEPGPGGVINIVGTVRGGGNSTIIIRGSGSTTHLNAPIITSGGSITVLDSIVLETPAARIDSTNAGASSGGAILIQGAVNSAASALNSLTLSSGSAMTTLGGAVGAATNGTLGALTVNSAGGIQINAGSIRTNQTQTYTGPVTLGAPLTIANAGAPITFNGSVGGAQNLTVAPGSGAVTFNGSVGGTTSLAALTINAGSTRTFNGIVSVNVLTIFGGTVEFNAAAAINTGVVISGILRGTGDITVALPLTWVGGDMTGTGKTIISATGSLVISGGPKTLSRTIENSGVAYWTDGDVTFSNATFRNQLGGAFYAQSGGSLTGAPATTNTFMNSGLVERSGVGSSSFTNLAFTSTGTINVAQGRFALATTSGTFINLGSISVAAASMLDITGNFAQNPAGSISFGIGSHDPLTGSGVLNVSGSATLGGSLAFTFASGFAPAAGDHYNLIRAASRSNQFSSVIMPTLPAGLTTVLNTHPNGVTLSFEPSTDDGPG